MCTAFPTTLLNFSSLIPETTLKVESLLFLLHVFHPLLLNILINVTLSFLQGLCDLCPSLEKQLLVFPGHKCGSLQLIVSRRHTNTHTARRAHFPFR